MLRLLKFVALRPGACEEHWSSGDRRIWQLGRICCGHSRRFCDCLICGQLGCRRLGRSWRRLWGLRWLRRRCRHWWRYRRGGCPGRQARGRRQIRRRQGRRGCGSWGRRRQRGGGHPGRQARGRQQIRRWWGRRGCGWRGRRERWQCRRGGRRGRDVGFAGGGLQRRTGDRWFRQ